MSEAFELYEPAMVLGSPAGVSAVCSCNWRTGIRDDLDEAISAYMDHVYAEHSDTATAGGQPLHSDTATASSNPSASDESSS